MVAEARRELVRVEDVRAQWSELASQAKAKMLAIPSAMAAQLAGLNAGEIQAALEGQIRAAMEALAA
jgi:phage terminase Nu1 subunit (DNA packaging protein)